MTVLFWCLVLSAGDASGIEEARAAFRTLSEKHAGLDTLAGTYVQERTSLLLREPIVSTGKLYFRKKPGCLVFRSESPSRTRMRLDEARYEVYREEKKQLERFPLESQEWPRALFQTFSHRVDELEKTFEILGSRLNDAPDAAHRVIQLRPTKASLQKRMTALRLTIRLADSILTGIGYTDPHGDSVEIRLSDVRVDPELSPELFELEPAPDAQVIVHEG